MSNLCEVLRLGIVPYEQAWQMQDALAAQVAQGKRLPLLLLLQHPHTYTFGRGGHPENLLWDDEELARRGVSIYWVDRGGDVTYHGPGQLVGYPLLPLAPGGLKHASEASPAAPSGPHLPQTDYVGYLRKLETTLILALMRLGIPSGQVKGLTGVWVQPLVLSRCTGCKPELHRAPAKIAAIGVKVDAKGVSRHGFALNVNPDMVYWEGIVGCGLGEYPVTCLAELLDQPPAIEKVMEEVTRAFGEVFGFNMIESPPGLEYATGAA